MSFLEAWFCSVIAVITFGIFAMALLPPLAFAITKFAVYGFYHGVRLYNIENERLNQRGSADEKERQGKEGQQKGGCFTKGEGTLHGI